MDGEKVLSSPIPNKWELLTRAVRISSCNVAVRRTSVQLPVKGRLPAVQIEMMDAPKNLGIHCSSKWKLPHFTTPFTYTYIQIMDKYINKAHKLMEDTRRQHKPRK